MSDLIDRQAVLDALSNAVPSLTTPDGCGQFDRELQIVGEALVDAMQIVHALPTASPWHRVEEDLPKEDGKYLVYMFTSAWRWEFKFAGYLHGRWIGAGGGDVRYWMPIEPPKEDADANE